MFGNGEGDFRELKSSKFQILGEKLCFGGLIFSSYNENTVLENMHPRALLCSVISCLDFAEFEIQS